MSDLAEQHRSFLASGGIADLSKRTKLRLTGADRVRYLNGQVTANVTRLTPQETMPACVTTAKGKLCGDVFLHATEDALLVDAEPVLREILTPRLERYIISDNVEIEDVTDNSALTSRARHAAGSEVGVCAGKSLRTSRIRSAAVAGGIRKNLGKPGGDARPAG